MTTTISPIALTHAQCAKWLTVSRERRRDFDDDFVRGYTYLLRVASAPNPLLRRFCAGDIIAQAEGDLLLVDFAADQGLDPIAIADEHSSELYAVAEALVDSDGMPTPLAQLQSTGNLLFVGNLEADPTFDFRAVARELLEAIIRNHSSRCAAVTYLLESFESPQVRAVLEERDFFRVPSARPSQKWTRVYAADTKLIRPGL